jgi:hypothetical protein
MAKGVTINIHIDGETQRLIESAARRRRRTVNGFVAEAALKEAVEIERAAAKAEGLSECDVEYVPPYFRACCEVARKGGTDGYRVAGRTLASELDRMMPHGVTKEEWISRLEELQRLVWPPDLRPLTKDDHERITDWFGVQFPQCMKLIPKRRSTRFGEGVVELAEEHNGIPGIPG